ncbi:MAG: aminotransferase class I/II-fold pyridoxal phosphate-dependent enzyme [Chloroflexi bacterium]|nr:aminotransferase class I/II-fold pyridoxal phosphate-dependent enzyme [Chloroflexota bacterium]
MIDLRSDVRTTPTDEMWEAMRRAEMGWASFGEDRSVNELEALGAELLGKEAAVLVPTCRMANLLGLMTLGERGTQAVLESTAHIVWSEAWSLAYICGLFPRLVEGADGMPDPVAVAEAIESAAFARLPRTSVVCLENSHNNAGGTAATAEQTAAIADVAHRYGAALHLDGARIFNSAIALGVPARCLAEAADTVAVSLHKGLCAPAGALLCGPRQTISAARANAQRLGAASIHKAGIFAAAGIVALTTMIDRLADDHRRALALAKQIVQVPGVRVDLRTVQTNIVLMDVTQPGLPANEFLDRLASRGVLALPRTATRVRFVTRRLIEDRDVDGAAEAIAAAVASPGLA